MRKKILGKGVENVFSDIGEVTGQEWFTFELDNRCF